ATTNYSWKTNVIQAGLRYDNRKISSDVYGDPAEEGYFAPINRSFDSFNASVGFKTDLKENLNLRLNLASGFRAPNLAELTRIENMRVPDGFCITTEAFKAVISQASVLPVLLDKLGTLEPDERTSIAGICAQIRELIRTLPVPDNIVEALYRQLDVTGTNEAYAVRSSATAEDLPTASFAGQQDSFLNVRGKAAILGAMRKCWASLYTDRAVMYRMQHGFDHHQVLLAVVVEKMVFPQSSGILFTANPVSGNRRELVIDAGFGLGEALVSGLVNADHYKIREGRIMERKVSAKTIAIYADEAAGTIQQPVPAEMQAQQVLSDEQILALAAIGNAIAGHFGQPQDIEWCFAGGQFHMVQSRPITTLFPVPQAPDVENHIYVSVGHQQMMTDPIRPLGLSLWLLTTPRHMPVAAGRLFVDITKDLTTRKGRASLMGMLGKSDPLIADALDVLIKRGDFLKPLPEKEQEESSIERKTLLQKVAQQPELPKDPAIVTGLIQESKASLARLKTAMATKSGTAVFDFIIED
ncbi:MAG: TonB-dependent receptor, partial [Sphingobacteriales bacterium]